MIHAYIRGRLGNQLFQYAYIRTLQKYNPRQNVCYHFDEVYSAGEINDDFKNALKDFNVVDVNEGNNTPNLTFMQKVLLKLYWFKYPHKATIDIRNKYQMKWVKWLDYFNLKYLDLGYYSFKKEVNGDAIISGNFESEKYFYEIRDQLLNEITPKEEISLKNMPLLKRMKETNSVSLSIRRGDFVNDKDVKELHDVCTKEYYLKAWNYIQNNIKDPVLFIFSNDIEWVKKHLDFGVETHYESGNDPSWEVLELMSNCKHFIMANSTFNWWAQYKCKNPEKIVIAPQKWWNNPLIPDIFMSNWKLVSVD